MNNLTTVLLSGALVTIGFWLLKQFAGIEPPVEVNGAVTTVVLAVVSHFWDKNGDGKVDV